MHTTCNSEEEMLQNQAKALDQAFHFILQRSFLTMGDDDLYLMEDRLHLAIKLQQQCTNTYKALQAAQYMNGLTAPRQNNTEAPPHPLPAIDNEQTINEE